MTARSVARARAALRRERLREVPDLERVRRAVARLARAEQRALRADAAEALLDLAILALSGASAPAWHVDALAARLRAAATALPGGDPARLDATLAALGVRR